MNRYYIIIILNIALLSCHNEKDISTSCFSDIVTSRTILNKQATIQVSNNEFYIIEKGTFDTKLLPCSLSDEYKINNLPVTISGEVKNTIPTGACCTEKFVILKITK